MSEITDLEIQLKAMVLMMMYHRINKQYSRYTELRREFIAILEQNKQVKKEVLEFANKKTAQAGFKI